MDDVRPPPGPGPRVLFIARSIAHFSYVDSILAGLLGRGANVEIAFDTGWSKKWRRTDMRAVQEFRKAHPGLVTSWLVRRSDAHRSRIFALRELRAYRSYLTRRETTPYTSSAGADIWTSPGSSAPRAACSGRCWPRRRRSWR